MEKLNQNQKQTSIVIVNVDFRESFDQLTEEEKNYLYYLSKACWSGQIIDLFQTSYESPALFMIFQMFFGSFKNIKDLDGNIKQIEPVTYKKFLEYAANFYSNFGNYTIKKKKFFPEFKAETEEENWKTFEKILSLSPKYPDFKSIWDIIKYIIFDKSENARNIDLEENDGKNCYYLGGIKKEEIEATDKILLSNDISLLNTRLFSFNKKVITLIGSVDEIQRDLDDKNILLYGEFSQILKKINQYLKEAQKHTTKKEDKDIIDDYVTFFTTGNIQYHCDSQKKWVKLNSPIDYNIGWTEVDIDPLSARGLFEGFVGFTDTFMSQKYEQIINLIPQLMEELPWSPEFNEKNDQIQFKAFEIICFAKKGCPSGKSLPNYFDIRKEFGSKNLIFSNVFPDFKESKDNYYFFSNKDKELISSFGQSSIKIKTSLKLLLGFGMGKTLKKEKDPETNEYFYNFNQDLKNPLTNEVIEKCYEDDETFEKKFGYNSFIINECIASLISLYLCGNESVQEIFYINKIDSKSVTQTIWLLFFAQVISNLNLYNEKEKVWTHSQSQASWIILNYIISEQKESEEIIKIELDEEKKEFTLNINKELLSDSINDIITKLVQKFYIYKCIGDVENAVKLIEKYSVIDNEVVLKVKKLVENDEENQMLYLYHNLCMENDKVIYKEYKADVEDIIRSNLDRFGEEFNKDIYNQWVKYATNFLKSK